jgi:hypothetical protein
VITKPVVEWTLAYPNGSTENGVSSVATLISSSVEYPAGTFTRLTYNGSVSATIDGTSILSSDANTLLASIPDGATFWVWVNLHYTSTNKAYYDDGLNFYYTTASGEVTKASTSALTDYTMVGGMVSGGVGSPGWSFRPVAIRDISTKLSAFLMGDSRQRKTQGVYGHVDPKGRTGEAQRAVGARMACINGAVSGDSYFNVTQAGAYTIRKALADRCDIIIDEYGINDLGTGVNLSVASFSNDINTMRALLGPTKPYFRQTITPRATSTNRFTDTAGQTPTSNASYRSALNDAIRNGTLTLNNAMAGYFETADAVETARNSGIIKPLSGRVLTDITVSANSTTVTSTNNDFTSADVGRSLFASSNNFGAEIVAYVSPTQVTISQSQTTAINPGDSVYVGLSTQDGLHYWPEAEILMAADPSWNQLGNPQY